MLNTCESKVYEALLIFVRDRRKTCCVHVITYKDVSFQNTMVLGMFRMEFFG